MVRSTSNPAFRNLPVGGGGYAGFNSAPARFPGAAPSYVDAPPTVGRPMTIDDVVTKTSITLAVLIATGAATYFSGFYGLALPAALIGFVLAMVVIFKKVVSPPLILAYAAVEGVFLGAISGVFSNMAERLTGSSSIVLQAITGTVLVFAAMLVVYKTGAVKVTPRFTKWLIGAMIGAVGLMLVNLIAGFFTSDGSGLGLRDGSPMAIIFSLVVIAIAAFSLLLDFDAADDAIRAGAPEKTAWYIAFGLTVTLVWLYLEILRLLSYFQSD